MKRIYFTLGLVIMFACTNNDKKFPPVKKISEYKKTVFLPALESRLSADKNSVYCATLLYAWEEVRKNLRAPVEISAEFEELDLFNNSKSYENTLSPGEYTAYGAIDGDIITARAEFSKSLPFGIDLSSFENELVFDNTKVSSFGTFGYGDSSGIIKILYYKSDNDFIISLSPKDVENEIILFKSATKYNSIAEMYKVLQSNISKGRSEILISKNEWKYNLDANDEVVIPKFSFNVEATFPEIEKSFTSKGNIYTVEKAWQRNAFVLDESGAEIESEAEIEVATEEVEVDESSPKVKKMRFDRPFLLVLKKREAKNPYFAVWAANAELMLRE